MERVKYFIPNIEVKCVTTYCRNGEIVKMLPGSGDASSVFIEYADGDRDSARIGHNDYYDLEFVHEKDALLQQAMERYPKLCTFTSLAGTEVINFNPKYPKWGDVDDIQIYIIREPFGNVLVYENGKWAIVDTDEDTETPETRKYDVGDTLVLLEQVKRNKDAYCNVDPSVRNLSYHNGWNTDVGEHKVLEIAYSPDKENWYYKISASAWYSQDSFEEVKKPVPSESSDVFPVEGQCKSVSVDLLEYLRKTRTPEGDQSLKDRAKAICWNHKGYWFVSRSSQKKEYLYEYLSQFFTQKPKPSMEPQAQQFEYTQQGGFQLTLPPEIVGAALSQATQTHFRESEKKFEKHREDVVALIDKKKQMIETELYQKFEKTISYEFVEFKQKVVEDYLTSKQVVIELGQDKKYEFSLEDKHSELPKMVTFLQLFKQAMIVGPSGSGKSTMAKQAAEVMGLRYGAFSCNLEASKSELVGFANIDGYVESSFLDFYENGGVFLVDEYDSMSPSIAVVLNAAFDRTGIIAVPNRKGKTIAKKHKDFYCILAGNTWGSGSVEYQGREMQDAAFLDRFKMCRIFIDYDEKLEKNIAGKHYSFFKKIRNYVKKKVDGENFSTRSMYDASVLLNNGFTQENILTMMSEHWDEALRKDLVTAVL